MGRIQPAKCLYELATSSRHKASSLLTLHCDEEKEAIRFSVSFGDCQASSFQRLVPNVCP